MIKKINISENDRRTILSMHKLIVEQSGEIIIQGTVMEDTESHEPYFNLNVKLYDSKNVLVDKGRARTDENGEYKMTIPSLVPGKYTLKFGDGDNTNNRYIEITSETPSPVVVNIDYKFTSQELPPVTVEAKSYRVPIFSVKVLTPKGENIEGAEIEIYHNDKSIIYSTFVGGNIEGKAFDANTDTDNKKTLSDGLKNIWINPITYPYFSSEKTDDVCVEHTQIKIVVKYQNNTVEKVVETCLNNGTYYISTDESKTLRVKITQQQDFEIILQQPLQKSLDTTQTTDVNYSDVNYSKIGFRELIKKSKLERKPAFILFSKQGDWLSDDLITGLNTNEETINKLNNKFIPANYDNDESDTEGYILAAEYLNVDKIPSIVIIQGRGDAQPIENSYTEIKRVTDLGSYLNNFKDYLTMVNDLLK
jgi:hypothetical protein